MIEVKSDKVKNSGLAWTIFLGLTFLNIISFSMGYSTGKSEGTKYGHDRGLADGLREGWCQSACKDPYAHTLPHESGFEGEPCLCPKTKTILTDWMLF